MQEKICQILKKFVSIPSTSDNPKALEKILEISLSYLKGFTVERFQKKGVKSALIYNSKKRPKKFKIILNAHLDVTPAKKNQFIPKVVNDRLYGAGAMDMKGGAVCLILAFKEMASKVNYPIALQLVTDEEVGGFNGTNYQIEKGTRAEFVIAGEPTNFDIVNKAKGVLWVKISTKGKSAHGAYPWRGENAIWKMQEFLNVLKQKYPIPIQEKWVTTVNLARIETDNQTFNKIPDKCTAWLDIRVVPQEANEILSKIKQLLPKSFTINVLFQEPPLFTKQDNEYIQTLKRVGEEIIGRKIIIRGANGTSDARHFAKVGCAGIEFGPVGGNIGADNEWVSISSLELYYQTIVKYLATFSLK